QPDSVRCPAPSLPTCNCFELPSTATSSLRLLVSMPAQIMLCLLIFVVPSLRMRTLGSINHPGPDEEPIAILLRTAVLYAAMGYDPTTGGPARRAIRAGPFLTERIHYTGP